MPGPLLTTSTLVAPESWGRGVSAAAKAAVMAHPVAAAVESFHVSIRGDNTRSVKAILKIPGVQFVGTSAEDVHPWRHYRWPPWQ
ncbi:hypothetical protein ACWEO2_26245 [Nocardia sp. NPDC004278]